MFLSIFFIWLLAQKVALCNKLPLTCKSKWEYLHAEMNYEIKTYHKVQLFPHLIYLVAALVIAKYTAV